uniref:Protein kinase domain-containing protein n=1 Tax=Fibrocapsa japonica TaxID=94617 RepID=A0A7S2Y012_9STRA|mmetsp:Transcript_3916/g.5827  ORF Transcript_3916/g.5827 Transcript_3916/m.5827 type:complete len:463 (+) Transcript_3916:23-1411(+)
MEFIRSVLTPSDGATAPSGPNPTLRKVRSSVNLTHATLAPSQLMTSQQAVPQGPSSNIPTQFQAGSDVPMPGTSDEAQCFSTMLPQKLVRFLSLSSFNTTERDEAVNVCDSDFVRMNVLGIGSFGKVLLVKKKDSSRLFAMKIIKKSVLKERMRARIRMERNVMALHRHPFIIKLHYAFQEEDKLYFVMDYCKGGDLYYHLHPSRNSRRSTSSFSKFVIAQLALALGHLHNHGIVYRDLKPENVLFDDQGYIKLADFGLAKGGIWEPTRGTRSVCGSLHYMAPELLLMHELGDDAEYGYAVDWWSLGVLLYEIFWGLPPWYCEKHDELVTMIKTIPLKINLKLPAPTRSFMTDLLIKDPQYRLGSAADVEEVKRHAYFERIDWQRLLAKQYAPCFTPCAAGAPEECVQNFDESFTRMPVKSSGQESGMAPCSSIPPNLADRLVHFDDFDFIINEEGTDTRAA